MKSLNFSLLKEKLLNNEKNQTIRCKFIPQFKIGEIIKITYQKEFLFYAIITHIYPKQLKDINNDEAKRDGFESKIECIKALKKLNNIKDLDHWCFIIRFKRIKALDSYF
ncbi:MAG TPA: hypothetical protein ENI51_07950 [Candidatus Atribacteria bacterium]|nr:hypothetical protein [Candidatus Atribacteria bacterium]